MQANAETSLAKRKPDVPEHQELERANLLSPGLTPLLWEVAWSFTDSKPSGTRAAAVLLLLSAPILRREPRE